MSQVGGLSIEQPFLGYFTASEVCPSTEFFPVSNLLGICANVEGMHINWRSGKGC